MKGFASFLNKDISVRYNPLIYFPIFFLTSALLSYFPFSTEMKVDLFLVGFISPVLLAIRIHPLAQRENQKQPSEVLSEIPLWILLIIFLLAIGLRFWFLNPLYVWPSGDDSMVGLAILDFFQNGTWKFFNGLVQLPPLTYWLGSFAFYVTKSSFFSLFLPSALASALIVPLSYCGMRRFFSKSFSVIFSFILAFSYWPLHMGRMFAMPSLLFFWELAVFYVLGCYLETNEVFQGFRWAAFLGLITGLGSLTFTSWIVVAATIFLAVIGNAIHRKRFLDFFVFSLSFGIAVIPFGVSIFHEGYGQHILTVGAWNDSDLKYQLSVFVNYFLILFGSINDDSASYIPVWGGILNPFLSAFFFLGVIEAFRGSNRCWTRWFFLIFPIFLASGFLSNTVEGYRVIQILFLLILGASAGVASLLRVFVQKKALLLGALFLICSGSLDFCRLIQPYWQIPAHPEKLSAVGKSVEKYKAYQILEEFHEKWGPGFIFTDLVPEYADESLTVMTYPFNAACNKSLSFQTVKWVAIFTGVDYWPFLAKRFPEARWELLPSQEPGQYSGHILGFFPINPDMSGDFNNWKKVHRFFLDVNTKMTGDRDGHSKKYILESMINYYPSIPPDPFLQSCFLDKLIFYYAGEKKFCPEDSWNNYLTYSTIINNCLRKGCFSPTTYEKLGRALVLEKHYAQARFLLDKVKRYQPLRGQVLNDIQIMNDLKKSNGRNE